MARILPIIAITAILIIIAVSGSAVTNGNMDWYHSLNLPSWTPPGYVIGIIWIILYILIGVAAWRIWTSVPRNTRFKTIVWIGVANLILNCVWSFIFFGMHNIVGGVVGAGALALTCLIVIVLGWPRDRLSAALLIPYCAWTSFATFLAATVLSLN